ncbi:rubrerythrin family protein [candidate division KSB1 bacterium]|nr:rubrerythrin family protein [candidate division KSB1 bacterium]
MKKMTENALKDAFSGESMASMKYQIFSDIAEKEGYPNLARMFRAISYAEKVHATNHARLLGMIKSTEENLQTGVDGETFEVDEMYPAYDAIAKLQKETGAERSMFFAIEAEKIHTDFYQKAKEGVAKKQDMNSEDIYICPTCGYTHIGELEEKCPICNAKSSIFKKF